MKLKNIVNKIKILYMKTNKKLLFIILITAIILPVSVIYIIKNNKNNLIDDKICYVRFNTNGGTQIDDIKINCGEIIPKPNNPIKQGFVFENWYFNDEIFNFENTIIKENIIINAIWKANEDTEIIIVHFDTNGGSMIDDIEIAKGSTVTPPINPIKKEYDFDSWYYENEKFNFTTPIYDNITLIAKWNKIKNNNQQNTATNNSSNNTIIGENTNIEVFNQYDNYANKYSGIWYLKGYSDVYFVVEKKEFYDTAYIYFEGVNFDLKSNKVKYTTISDFVLKYNDWENDLKKNGIKFKNSSILVNNLEFVKNSGSKSRYDDTYYYKSLGTWYMYNKPESQIIIKSQSNGYTGVMESINYDYACIDMVKISGITASTRCNSVKDNKIYEQLGITIDNDILYFNVNNEKTKFYKTPTEIEVSSINLDKSSINMNVYDTVTLNATISPYDAYKKGIIWTSSNDSIASVNDKGVVIANGVGTTIITATSEDGNKKANCTVNVSKINVTGITLNNSNIDLIKGNSKTLVANIIPNNATNKNVNWISSNNSVATVNNGVVTAIGKGQAIITVSINDGNYKADCLVNVSNPALSANVSIGYQISVGQNGAIAGVNATLTGKGGTGIYTYYNIKLFTSDGSLIAQTTDTSNNSIIAIGYKNGSYYATFEIVDSDGQSYNGTTNIYTISGY